MTLTNKRTDLAMSDPPDPSTSGVPPAPAISAVTATLKLPPFWPADPDLWFAQVEAQFACRHITSQRSKFDQVVSSLAPEYAAEVRDLLLKPPADHPYDNLKAQLIRRTAASEQRKLQQLFTTEDLGDRKPTQLLRRMQQLLGDRPGVTDGSFLKELFLQRLPPNVRMVLASTSLDKLAEMADKIIEVAVPSVSAVSASTPAAPTSEIEQLRAEVTRLEKMVSKLAARPRSSSCPPARPSRRPPSPAPSVSPPDPTNLCWYHQMFGDRAQQCRSPCAWSSNGQAGH